MAHQQPGSTGRVRDSRPDVDSRRQDRRATLEEAEHRWGPLSSTYRSTSRLGDSVSGQRFYRVPLGMLFRSVIEPPSSLEHIDTIQPHLRVSAVWPSIHPNTGEVYRWVRPDGSLLPGGMVPRVGNLPELPTGSVEGMARTRCVTRCSTARHPTATGR